METLFNLDLLNYDCTLPVYSRPSVRGIIMYNDLIALVYSHKYQYYKFPGGGINDGEKQEETLLREVKEETGLNVLLDSIKPYGKVKRRQKSNKGIFEQENYYYLCKVDGSIEEQKLDEYEDEEGFELQFVTIQKAIEVNRQCKELNDSYIVMVERDTRILERLIHQEEIPTVLFADLLLEEGWKKNIGPWKDHSKNVALAAKQIAHNCGMEEEKAYVLGLLHDIGRQFGVTDLAHVYDGYHYMMSMNYPAVAKICLTHSFNLQDFNDFIGKIDISEEKVEEIKTLLSQQIYDDYDYLISLSDSLGMHTGIVDIITRMSDVKRRHGYYPESKWNQNLYLQSYFKAKEIEYNRKKGL